MTDIVERIRKLRFVHVPVASGLMEEAAAEIERLRTLATHATPSEDSVQGEGTETLGHRLVERLSITQEMLGDNEKLRAEIERLREVIRRLAEQDATLSVQGGSVTVTLDATLTDEERAALCWFAHYGLPEHRAATLRSLLARLHT
jgi:hypothetical protein